MLPEFCNENTSVLKYSIFPQSLDGVLLLSLVTSNFELFCLSGYCAV